MTQQTAPQTPGEKLAAHRRAAGLNQADVAERIGRSTSHICQVEKGYTPSLARRDEIARAVGASVGSFWPL